MSQLKLAKQPEQDIIQQYYNYLLNSDLSASAKEYTKDIRQFAKWFPNHFSPQAVSTLDIVQYRSDMKDKNLSPATINRRLNAIKSFLKFCKKENLVRTDPAADVKLIKQSNFLAPKWLERKEQ